MSRAQGQCMIWRGFLNWRGGGCLQAPSCESGQHFGGVLGIFFREGVSFKYFNWAFRVGRDVIFCYIAPLTHILHV